MPLITETYYLSLTQDNRGILRLRCSQDDTLRTVNLKLYNNGSIFVIPSGVSASISGVKQNGAVFSKSCTISQDRKSVVLQLSSDITNVDGVIIAEIVLNDGEGGRLGTSNFIIQVEKNPIRAGVVQDTETPIEYVNDFITQIQALTARLNNLITPNGDASLAEVVDARISSLDGHTYQNLKARIDADIATLNTRKANKSEVYTKSQVDTLLDNVEIDVDDELSDESENPVQNKVINRTISEIKADLGDVSTIKHEMGDLGWREITFTPDSFINLSGSTADVTQMTSPGFGFSCAVVMCSPGDKFLLNLTGGGRARAWGFVKGDKSIIAVADTNVTVNNLTITAPDGAMYLVLNDNSGRKSYKNAKTVVDNIGFLEEQVGVFHWNKRGYIVLNVDPVDLTPVANSGINCMIIDCEAGDKFVVSGSGGNTSRLWGFVDSNNHILAVADANTVADGLEITAPENATKLIVNNQYSLADGVVLRVGSLACKVANLETPEIVKTAEFKISGCGFDQDPNDKKWRFRFNTATNRAVTKKPISIVKGVFRAKSGYEITVHQLTSNNRDSYGYTDVLWHDYSRFNWSTNFSIYPGCKYAFLHIRKTDNSDFTENEIKTLWEDAITVEYAEKDGKVNKNNGVLMTEKAGCASQITIAANNSTEHDKEIADYVCCGVNDENVLQAAINYFGDNSGVIQLCNGMYNIDKFKRIDGYDYGLYIEEKLREIIIRGCNHNHKARGDSFEGADKCPVIRVGNTAWNGLDSTKESYVIGSNREWVFPYKVLGVEDLTIALPDNTKPVVGIDGMYLADLHVYRCFFRTEGTYTDDVNINPKCIAIRGCPGGQIGYNYSFEHIKIIGWGTGLQFNGEASTIIDVQVQRAAYGFVFGDIDELNPYPRHGGIHPSVMIDCGAANCAKSIAVFGTGNRNTIEIIAFNCESGGDNYTIPGKVIWKAEHLFEYRSNGTMMGSVTYAFVDVLGGWRPNPINIWGDDHSADPYFRTTDLRAKTKGTTEERPENPCFMSKYYDTTIEKFIMFNGTAWVEIS